MSIVKYIQDNQDGTYAIREIEERTRIVGNIDDAINSELDPMMKECFKSIKNGKRGALTEEEINTKINEHKKNLEGK